MLHDPISATQAAAQRAALTSQLGDLKRLQRAHLLRIESVEAWARECRRQAVDFDQVAKWSDTEIWGPWMRVFEGDFPLDGLSGKTRDAVHATVTQTTNRAYGSLGAIRSWSQRQAADLRSAAEGAESLLCTLEGQRIALNARITKMQRQISELRT